MLHGEISKYLVEACLKYRDKDILEFLRTMQDTLKRFGGQNKVEVSPDNCSCRSTSVLLYTYNILYTNIATIGIEVLLTNENGFSFKSRQAGPVSFAVSVLLWT